MGTGLVDAGKREVGTEGGGKASEGDDGGASPDFPTGIHFVLGVVEDGGGGGGKELNGGRGAEVESFGSGSAFHLLKPEVVAVTDDGARGDGSFPQLGAGFCFEVLVVVADGGGGEGGGFPQLVLGTEVLGVEGGGEGPLPLPAPAELQSLVSAKPQLPVPSVPRAPQSPMPSVVAEPQPPVARALCELSPALVLDGQTPPISVSLPFPLTGLSALFGGGDSTRREVELPRLATDDLRPEDSGGEVRHCESCKRSSTLALREYFELE